MSNVSQYDMGAALERIEGKLDALINKLALPSDAQKAECRKCGGEMFWSPSLTRSRRDGTTFKYPVNADGTPHWDVCPAEQEGRTNAAPAQDGQSDIPF